jgi:hypothetical protein
MLEKQCIKGNVWFNCSVIPNNEVRESAGMKQTEAEDKLDLYFRDAVYMSEVKA